MVFAKRLREGVRRGEITCSVRIWTRPHVQLRKLRFVLLLACVQAAFSQVQSGRLVGTIYDPTHAAVAGATVTVTDVATNIAKRVTADGAGDYVITPLDPGTYSVTATA